MSIPIVVSINDLKEQAEKAAQAQEQKAAETSEDSEHWHHVFLANLFRTLAAALPPASGKGN